VVVNRIYNFLNKWSWKEVLQDVADLEDSGQTKTNGIIISVTDQVSWVQVFEPDLEEEIQVVQEFDKV
jgi:hypothetical protein